MVESAQTSKMSNSSKPSLEAGGTVDSDSEYNDAKKYPSGAFIDTGLRIGAVGLSLTEGTLMSRPHHSIKQQAKHNHHHQPIPFQAH